MTGRSRRQIMADNPLCKSCGAQSTAGSRFCLNCGGKLSEEEQEAKGLEPVQRRPIKFLFINFEPLYYFVKRNIDRTKTDRYDMENPVDTQIRQPKAEKKTITETRCTCNSCGKVWHYGKQEQIQNVGNAMSNVGKSMSCCTGCLPAVFIPDKKVVNLNKCPECGSKNIRKEQIVHAVPK